MYVAVHDFEKPGLKWVESKFALAEGLVTEHAIANSKPKIDLDIKVVPENDCGCPALKIGDGPRVVHHNTHCAHYQPRERNDSLCSDCGQRVHDMDCSYADGYPNEHICGSCHILKKHEAPSYCLRKDEHEDYQKRLVPEFASNSTSPEQVTQNLKDAIARLLEKTHQLELRLNAAKDKKDTNARIREAARMREAAQSLKDRVNSRVTWI